MKQKQAITEQIYRISGLRVTSADTLYDMPPDGVLTDEREDVTLFWVPCDGKQTAFAVDGSGPESRIIAVLAREYAMSLSAGAAYDDPVRSFLSGDGELPSFVTVGKYDYYVFAIHSDAPAKNISDYFATMSDTRDLVAEMGDGVTAFCKKADNDTDYRSAGEFAVVLKENLTEEIKGDVKIGVGGVAHGVSELPLFFSYARSALVNGAEFDPHNDIYSYKEYALIKTLSALSAADMEKYVKTVLDRNYREVLNDEELMTAAETFIKYSLNISEASRNMYVHRNTLIYRLDKIEKLTGLNIRNFNEAMMFRVACLVYKLR